MGKSQIRSGTEVFVPKIQYKYFFTIKTKASLKLKKSPLQIRDGADEPDTVDPEPAVLLWSNISGGRGLRLPEVAHNPSTLQEQKTTHAQVNAI